MSDLVQRLERLTPLQRKIFLRQVRKKQESTPVSIQARESGKKNLPLSFAQERLWFLNQLEPLSTIYHMPAAFRLSGPFSVYALARTINRIVERHEILRTTFSEQAGKPIQIVESTLFIKAPLIDLCTLPIGIQDEQVSLLLQQESSRLFDLSKGPLLRVSLIRLAAQEHLLLFTMHHIISDGWSIDILVREFSTLYLSEPNPTVSVALSPLPIQYADYALWQRQWLQDEQLQAQLSYWRQQLQDAPALLQFPLDHPRPSLQKYAGATQTLLLPVKLLQELKDLSQHEGTTLFMTLLAVFQILLMRYSGQEDIVVGTPVANRRHVELEDLIGFFVNTLVLRTDLSGDPSFRQLLLRVREVTLLAYTHQDLPFERLVEELQPERSLSYSPLCQVIFAQQNAPKEEIRLHDLTLQPLDLEQSTAKFDIVLQVQESAQGLLTTLEYSTTLFESTTIARLLRHWQMLLEAVVVKADVPITRLPLLAEDETQLILHKWNQTQREYPSESCIHTLFEQQARCTPDAIALLSEEMLLTYAEVNERANQLAYYLRTLFVEPEVLVGVYMERSPRLLIALLGILKAGGAYVPLDTAYPQERIALMLADTTAPLILTELQLAPSLANQSSVIVSIDQIGAELASQPTSNPVSRASVHNLAYVMYTSGSTGRPKGVAVTHQNVVRLVQQTNYVELGPEKNFLQFAPGSFDASTFEIWGALLNGACLALPPAVLLTLAELREMLHRYQISTLWLTAELFHQMVDQHLEAFAPLHQLLAGGDVLSVNHVKKVLEHFPAIQVINGYGPTEGTTFSCCYPLSASNQLGATVPIGYPIANTQVYLLDKYYNLVPVGVAGEMYIAGDGVARGYLQQPAQTAERFIPHPFDTGVRLYKTGDLARYRADGSIEFLGRADQQIKLRGFRIEPGEIEAALVRHPAVQEAVVLLHEESAARRYLSAYVVRGPGQILLQDDLRTYLQTRLPAYMVPATFSILDTLPITTNGKVDRHALAALGKNVPVLQESFVPPRDQREEALAAIWAEVLNLPHVSIHENFFALGGHSLLAMQVIAAVRQRLHVDLAVRALFEQPTIAELAELIQQIAYEGKPRQSTIVPVERSEYLPLSFAQERLWFLDQLEPLSTAYTIPAALRFRGPLNLALLERSLHAVIQRHEVLRTTFSIDNDTPIQVIAPTFTLHIPLLDLRDLPEEMREQVLRLLIQQEANRPFDLQVGPLLRATLVCLETQEYVLLFTMHHIVADGWSSSVLIREMGIFYQAALQDKVADLPELPLQYADFALWQRTRLQGEFLQEQLDYWRQQLAGAPEVLALPMDRVYATSSTAGARQVCIISLDLLQELNNLSQREGVTLFMTLLATFQVLLLRYSGQHDIVTGTSNASRNYKELEGLIGFFLNLLVIRTDLSGNPSFRALLARVREITLDAYAHVDLPFEKLVEDLQPQRSINRSPLFQVLFVLQNTPHPELMLTGLSWNQLELEPLSTKYDLKMEVQETSRGLYTVLEYHPERFEEATITRLLTYWRQLLEAIVATPEQTIENLPLLPESEYQQLTTEWSAAPRIQYPPSLLHQLFEDQVALTPDAIALVYADEQLSYSLLNSRANQLARYLQCCGVGPDVRVGVGIAKSASAIVSLLAILKAGGAYVALNADLPTARLMHILRESEVAVVLTQANFQKHIPYYTGTVVLYEQLYELLQDESEENLQVSLDASHLAYVTYTSGSTGRPKGVMTTHKGAVNYLRFLRSTYQLDSCMVVLQLPPLSFDASVRDILGTFSVGARLILTGEQEAKDPAVLLSQIRYHQVTSLLSIVPSFLSVLLNGAQALTWTCSTVRLILSSGEGLPLVEIMRVRQVFSEQTVVVNQYGPTETTMTAAWYRLENPEDELGKMALVGRPITNMQVYLLDQHYQPVPIGAPGEVYLGGVGLARGYVAQPGLTAEQFVPHPFSPIPGERLYRTGDIARYLADGNIEYIGRKDQQIKLRGNRVELGEIEVLLERYPGIQRAIAAIYQQNEDAEQQLVAYVLSEPEQTPTLTELRDFAQEHLPGYMVPTYFVPIGTLPLNAHGKLDRRALPDPDRSLVSTEIVLPETPLQEQLAKLWATLLHLPQVGIYDNFFEIGGHSLLAMQLLSLVRSTFAIEVPVRDLFEKPTIAYLAQIIEHTQDELLAQIDHEELDQLIDNLDEEFAK